MPKSNQLSRFVNPIDVFVPILEVISLTALGQFVLRNINFAVLVWILFTVVLFLLCRDHKFISALQRAFGSQSWLNSLVCAVGLSAFTMLLWAGWSVENSNSALLQTEWADQVTLGLTVIYFFGGLLIYSHLFYKKTDSSLETQNVDEVASIKSAVLRFFCRAIVILQASIALSFVDRLVFDQKNVDEIPFALNLILFISISFVFYYPSRMLELAYNRTTHQMISYLVSVTLVALL